MLKTILTAACASALLAGTAFAGDSASHSKKMMDKPIVQSDSASTKMRSEADRNSLSNPARRQSETGGVPSQENPYGTNNIMPSAGARTTSDRAPGATAGTSSSMSCRGMASEEETTRCLNRQSAQLAERGMEASQIKY